MPLSALACGCKGGFKFRREPPQLGRIRRPSEHQLPRKVTLTLPIVIEAKCRSHAPDAEPWPDRTYDNLFRRTSCPRCGYKLEEINVKEALKAAEILEREREMVEKIRQEIEASRERYREYREHWLEQKADLSFPTYLLLSFPTLPPVNVPVRPVQLPARPGAAAGGLAGLHLLQHIRASATGRLDLQDLSRA
jgi:hypothetical protein